MLSFRYAEPLCFRFHRTRFAQEFVKFNQIPFQGMISALKPVNTRAIIAPATFIQTINHGATNGKTHFARGILQYRGAAIDTFVSGLSSIRTSASLNTGKPLSRFAVAARRTAVYALRHQRGCLKSFDEENGRPVFSDRHLPRFSISYTGNIVGVALTTEGDCGLDMELQRTVRSHDAPTGKISVTAMRESVD